jgi:hypothetical protein
MAAARKTPAAPSVSPFSLIESGDAEHFELAWALACPEHCPPELFDVQLPLASALYVMCCATQSAAALTSFTNSCTAPLHTTAPCELHCDWQCDGPLAVHCAKPCDWQLTEHEMFACPVQSPWQLAWHFASQVAVGGVPEHCASQSDLHVAWHLALQSAWEVAPFVLPEHCPVQLPLQSLSHCPEHVKVGGFALHAPVQFPWQEPVQDADAVAWQFDWQLEASCALQ